MPRLRPGVEEFAPGSTAKMIGAMVDSETIGSPDYGYFGLRGSASGRMLSETTQGGVIAGVDVLALQLDQFLVQAVIILSMTR